MSNYHSFTFYWSWRVGRLSFMCWTHLSQPRLRTGFFKLNDGGWLLQFLDTSIGWHP